MWQRYVNHTAQFLDTTAGAATPGLLDQLSCANTGWTSVVSSLLTPTSILSGCRRLRLPRGVRWRPDQYQLRVRVWRRADQDDHSGVRRALVPKVLTAPVLSGNDIRDFSLAQEACIWFGDGCIRDVGY